MIPVAKPFFSDEEKRNLKLTIDTGWISSKGQFIEEFEESFAKKYGAKYAVAVSNGTTALQLALVAAGVGKGDEVLVPDFTFISSANSVVHAGAKPVFVDIEKTTWNIDPKDIEKKISKRTKAIMPVHLYGHPANMREIMRIAKKYGLRVIEDCAESQGAMIGKSYVGSIGDVGCFSFFGNKIITTGEGGMCLTSSKKLFEQMVIYRAHGMDPKKRYHHPVIGFNFRMTNMQAAVGLGQLHNVDRFIKRREQIRRLYEKCLSEEIRTDKIQTTPSEQWASPVCWFYSILVPKEKRDKLIKVLENNDVETRPFFPPISRQSAYSAYTRVKTPVSLDISERGINLPTFFELKDDKISEICKIIKGELK